MAIEQKLVRASVAINSVLNETIPTAEALELIKETAYLIGWIEGILPTLQNLEARESTASDDGADESQEEAGR